MIGKIDKETLSGLVACIARTDTTAPDPNNPRSGWWTDILLTAIDKYVIGQENDPAAYAEIARQALAQLQAAGRKAPEIVGAAMMVASDQAALLEAAWGQPEVVALLGLAEFRGERLLPVSPEREQSLIRMAQGLEDTIAFLPAGNRKARCLSLLRYHTGVFYDDYGHFAQAAEAQKRAAEEADFINDRPGAAICRFLEAVYHLKQALCEGKIGTLYWSFLESRFKDLVEVTRGMAMEVQWGQDNGSRHMIEACVWLNTSYCAAGWDTWVTTALAAAEKLGQAFAPGARFVQAVDLDKRNDPEAESALTAVAGDDNQTDEIKATALLVLARRNRDKASWFVTLMPEEAGAQHVRAIAARLLPA